MVSYETDDYNDMFFNPGLCVPYEYITTKEQLLKHVRAIKESPAIGIDTETTGLQPFTTKIKTMDFSKSVRDLKHDPKHPPEEGIKRTVEWMKWYYRIGE